MLSLLAVCSTAFAEGTVKEQLKASIDPNNIKIKVGDIVNTDTKVGEVVSMGNSTCNHLHFEMSWQDPYEFFKDQGTKLICGQGFGATKYNRWL